MKIALISTGLGHIKRGIETWTEDMGKALSSSLVSRRSFLERPATSDQRPAEGIEVTVYKGAGRPETPYERVIPCWKRDNKASRWLIKHRPGFLWRFGLATGYTLEQMTFNWNILPKLIIKQFDIIHTQDPQVAEFIQKLFKRKIIKSRVILAHGTEEPFEFLGQFDYLQHLAPYHKEETEAHGFKGKKWFAIGNFVDTKLFKPGINTNLRQELNIPAGAFVVLSVAAIKRTHKRIDYLINEVSRIKNDKVYLLVAGSKGTETQSVIKLGQEKLGTRAVFLSDFPHSRIQEVYAVANLFALCSLKDMMPIALLEAIATGLPAVVHKYPVEEWMIGHGGDAIDMAQDGGLAARIEMYLNGDYRRAKAIKAREHAERNFSKEVIVEQILNMYDEVLKG